MMTEESQEPEAPLSVKEATELTDKVSKLLDDIEDVGLRLSMFFEKDEQTKPLLTHAKTVVSIAFMVNSECVMSCYDKYGILVTKSRHCDMPVSAPTGYSQALEIADLMVDAIREVEEPVTKLVTPGVHATPNQAALETLQMTETTRRLYMALEYSLGIRGALLLIQSGFDFTAMNSALGLDKPIGGRTTFE